MDFRILIEQIRQVHNNLYSTAVRAVNISLTIRNWTIGYHIFEFEQKGEDRAAYGENLLKNIEKELKKKNLSNINERELRRYRLFYLTYSSWHPYIEATTNQLKIRGTLSPISDGVSVKNVLYTDIEPDRNRATLPPELREAGIVVPPQLLISKLSYSHFIELLSIDDKLKRSFYEIESIKGSWSVRELRRQIESMYFERSGISIDKETLSKLINQSSEITDPKDIIKDVYAFEFLGLPHKEKIHETELEQALLDNFSNFILELGLGFCLEARQKRIIIGEDDNMIDLVFYHRILKCHVLVDLKTTKFKSGYAGQMNAYLNYYKNEIKLQKDNHPIGLILCTDKNNVVVEYATTGLSENIFVKKYLIELPSKQQLETYLQKEMDNLLN